MTARLARATGFADAQATAICATMLWIAAVRRIIDAAASAWTRDPRDATAAHFDRSIGHASAHAGRFIPVRARLAPTHCIAYAHPTAVRAPMLGIATVGRVIDAAASARARETRDAAAEYFRFIRNAGAVDAMRRGRAFDSRALVADRHVRTAAVIQVAVLDDGRLDTALVARVADLAGSAAGVSGARFIGWTSGEGLDTTTFDTVSLGAGV
jgi:hypothetical protein